MPPDACTGFGCSTAAWLANAVTGLGQFVEDLTVGNLAKSVMKALGTVLINLGTFWVKVPSPSFVAPTSSVTYIQQHVAWLVPLILLGTMMYAGIQVISHRRGEPLRRVVQSVLTVAAVSGAGALIGGGLVLISDSFSIWLMNEVTEDNAASFAVRILPALEFAGIIPGGAILVIIVGIVGVIANIIQLGMMWLRSAGLLMMLGVVVVMAATTGTEWGRRWFSRAVGFFLALVLYKPTVTIVYATAIRLVADDSTLGVGGVVSFIVGILMMLAAAFCPGALVAFLMPPAMAIGSGSVGGGGAVAGGAVLATGAIDVAHDVGVRHDVGVSASRGADGTAPQGAANTGGAAPGAAGASAQGPAHAAQGASNAAGSAAAGASAGAATGGAVVAAEAVAEGAGRVREAIDRSVEAATTAPGAEGER